MAPRRLARRRLQPDRGLRGIGRRRHARDRHDRVAGPGLHRVPVGGARWCLSKSRAKALLRGMALPTAPFAVVEPRAPIPEWSGPWPVMVKPDSEDASLGIDQRSVAAERGALIEQTERVRAHYGGRVLLEAYLPGPEFNVGLLALPDPEPLPIAEVVFATEAGAWPILTYESKWVVGSSADLASPIRCPAQIDDVLARSLGRLAVAAFTATGCRDYARVDFRLDQRGEPMILEVNPNPDLGPSAGWARAVVTSGRDYAATLAAPARQALARGPLLAAGVRTGTALLDRPIALSLRLSLLLVRWAKQANRATDRRVEARITDDDRRKRPVPGEGPHVPDQSRTRGTPPVRSALPGRDPGTVRGRLPQPGQ